MASRDLTLARERQKGFWFLDFMAPLRQQIVLKCDAFSSLTEMASHCEKPRLATAAAALAFHGPSSLPHDPPTHDRPPLPPRHGSPTRPATMAPHAAPVTTTTTRLRSGPPAPSRGDPLPSPPPRRPLAGRGWRRGAAAINRVREPQWGGGVVSHGRGSVVA